MLCSTIIPTVNRPSLERAVKSALRQELGREQHEIFVVNDSGNPLPDFDWLRSPQILVVNTNRCERSMARNVGATIATGKYINFLDDDDYLLSGALKELINKAEASNSAWVYGAHNRIDDNDVIKSLNKPEVKGNLFAHMVAGDCIHIGASLIKREEFFRAGCFDPRLKVAEDRDLEVRFAIINYFERIDQTVSSIRVGETSASTTDWAITTSVNRLVREKAFDLPRSAARILNSVGTDLDLRGRCSRAYLISALLNFRAGRIFVAFSRLFNLVPLVGLHLVRRKFWEGFFTRSHWHRFEKHKEIKYQESYSDRDVKA